MIRTSTPKIKICIADDHPFIREGLRRTIDHTADLTVDAEAGDGQEVLEVLRKKRIDLLLLDISMPIRSGVDLLKQIRTKWPKMPVLILTAYPEVQYAARAFKLGASGYLTKDSSPHELIAAVRVVLSRKRYVSPSFAEQLVDNLENEDPTTAAHEKLSNRELEVLCQLAAGKPLIEIAGDLFLSVKTISTYRARLLEKLKLTTNAELIRYAIRHHLTEI